MILNMPFFAQLLLLLFLPVKWMETWLLIYNFSKKLVC